METYFEKSARYSSLAYFLFDFQRGVFRQVPGIVGIPHSEEQCWNYPHLMYNVAFLRDLLT